MTGPSRAVNSRLKLACVLSPALLVTVRRIPAVPVWSGFGGDPQNSAGTGSVHLQRLVGYQSGFQGFSGQQQVARRVNLV